MFGTYRILLALTVVFVHIAQIAELSGLYAVFGFFILSGYLMTLIMNESYGYTPNGIGAYAINRFLRIYPIYWLSCLLALGIILLIGDELSIGKSAFYLPENWQQWVRNFALILDFSSRPQLIQPAWTLTIELFFYLCIGAGLSRTRLISTAWLIVSAIYTGWLLTSHAGDYQRFFTLAAASLPFSMGASLYHWRKVILERCAFLSQSNWLPAALFILFLLNIAVSHQLEIHKLGGFYLNMAICAVMVVSLHPRRSLPAISRKLDNSLGDLSYPVYLIHAPLSWLLLYLCKLTGMPISGPSLETFAWFITPVMVVSWLMAVSIEKPIDLIRNRIKRLI